MKDNFIMLPEFILDRGQKNFKIIGPPIPLEYNAGRGIIDIYENVRPLSKIKEAFSKTI